MPGVCTNYILDPICIHQECLFSGSGSTPLCFAFSMKSSHCWLRTTGQLLYAFMRISCPVQQACNSMHCKQPHMSLNAGCVAVIKMLTDPGTGLCNDCALVCVKGAAGACYCVQVLGVCPPTSLRCAMLCNASKVCNAVQYLDQHARKHRPAWCAYMCVYMYIDCMLLMRWLQLHSKSGQLF